MVNNDKIVLVNMSDWQKPSDPIVACDGQMTTATSELVMLELGIWAFPVTPCLVEEPQWPYNQSYNPPRVGRVGYNYYNPL